MDHIAVQVVVTVLLSLLIVGFSGAAIYGATRSEDSTSDRVGGAAFCLLVIVVLSVCIAYVWS